MKLETGIIIAKGAAHVTVGAFTPWTAALAQWIGSGEWPSRIVWIGVILPASLIGAGSALQAFLSASFTNYRAQAKADSTGKSQTVTTEPAPPKETKP